MKKALILLMLSLFFLLPMTAQAEVDFVLDTAAVVTGMDVSWQQGYTPAVQGSTMTLYLPIRSERNRGYITATLVSDGETATPFKSRQEKANAQLQNGLYALKMTLALRSDRTNGDYPILIRVTGKDAEGTALSTDIPLTIRIRNALPPQETHRPGIAGVNAALIVGQNSTLTAALTNPAQNIIMENVMLTVTDATGDILPAGSNKLSLPSLLPGETQTVTVPLTVLPKAAVGLHTLAFELTYTALGQSAAWSEHFTIPVQQEMRLAHGDLSLASTLLQGDLATLTLPVMNLGRADLVNVFVSLTLPGIVQRQSVLIGTIAPGETKQARLTFTPGMDMLGEVTGTILITAEDAGSNTTSLELPVSTFVEEAPPDIFDASSTAAAEEEEAPWLIWLLGGTGGVLLLALIVQGMLLRRKIRRMEEEQL